MTAGGRRPVSWTSDEDRLLLEAFREQRSGPAAVDLARLRGLRRSPEACMRRLTILRGQDEISRPIRTNVCGLDPLLQQLTKVHG